MLKGTAGSVDSSCDCKILNTRSSKYQFIQWLKLNRGAKTICMLTFRCDSNAAHTPKRILADQLSKQRQTRKTLPEHTEVVLLEAPGERSSIRPSPDRQVSLWVYECCVTKIANHAGAGISENNRGSRLVCKPVEQVSPLVFLSSASILASYKQWRHFAGNLITGGKCFRLPVFLFIFSH